MLDSQYNIPTLWSACSLRPDVLEINRSDRIIVLRKSQCSKR